jgi:hypothetical protein
MLSFSLISLLKKTRKTATFTRNYFETGLFLPTLFPSVEEKQDPFCDCCKH